MLTQEAANAKHVIQQHLNNETWSKIDMYEYVDELYFDRSITESDSLLRSYIYSLNVTYTNYIDRPPVFNIEYKRKE